MTAHFARHRLCDSLHSYTGDSALLSVVLASDRQASEHLISRLRAVTVSRNDYYAEGNVYNVFLRIVDYRGPDADRYGTH